MFWLQDIVPNHMAFDSQNRILMDVLENMEGEYPFGEDIWKDTHLFLPEGTPSKWIHATTGELINSERALEVGTIFQHFPVSLIQGV